MSKTSSESATVDDQLFSDSQELVQEAIMRSLKDVAPEEMVNTEGEESVTERERTITRGYSKLRGGKRGKGKAKK